MGPALAGPTPCQAMQPPDPTTLPDPPDAGEQLGFALSAASGLSLAPGSAWRADDAGGQLGLDGRAYAPQGPAGASTAEAVDPSLGTLREVSWDTPVRPPEGPASEPSRQVRLRLHGDEWDEIPALAQWDRARVAGRLGNAVALAAGKQDNLAKCCHGTRVTASANPSAYRTDRGKWVWSGLATCRDRCCPRCGPTWARQTSQAVGALLDRWLHGDESGLTDPDAWMLSIAPPRTLDEDLERTLDDLYMIIEEFLACDAWRAFALKYGLAHVDERSRWRRHAAVVPFLDVTFGGRTGCHPHFHILLMPSAARVAGADRRRAAEQASAGRRPEDPDAVPSWEKRAQRVADDRALALDPLSRWDDAPLRALDQHERCTLLERFAADAGLYHALVEIIQQNKPRERAPFKDRRRGIEKGDLVPIFCSKHALRLSPGEDAERYFSAWGLDSELGAGPLKGKSHLRLLDAAAAGVDLAGEAWQLWRAAVKGRQWAPGLGAARRRLHVSDEDVSAYAQRKQAERDAANPPTLVEPVLVTIPHYLWSAALLVGLDNLERAAAAAADAGGDAQEAVSALCWANQVEANRRTRERPPPPD